MSELRIDLKDKIITDGNLRYCEIYKLTNTINQKVYIGQVVSHRMDSNIFRPKGMKERFKQHVNEAFPKTVTTYHCNALNNAIRKYGKEMFTLELLRNCKMEDANRIETEEIFNHNSLIPNGYNITTSCNSIQKPSDEFREKISKGNLATHEEKRIQKYKDIIYNNGFKFDVDESKFCDYITPRTKYGTQIGWYVRLNKTVIEFKSTINSIDETKQRAIEFLKKIKELSLAKHLDAGIPLEPSLPLQLGNILEEHG
uniref:GIY-YIG domain-containing protein n=1 Tax=viral metagenome TaxID=1070528 RepID=A0A6C0JDW1_9ZZZZ